MKIEIEHIDPTTIMVKSGHEIVKGLLSYKCEYWRPGQYSKVKSEYEKSFLYKIKKEFFCYAGFIQRIKDHCQKAGIEYVEIGERERLEPLSHPTLKAEWRPGQLETVLKAAKEQQGIVEFAPGIGKTTTAVGIVSCFPPKTTVLFLCHEIGLVQQAYNRFVQAGYKSISMVSGKNKEINTDIIIATCQTYKNLDLVSLSDRFSIIFIDECHYGMAQGSSYEKILKTSLAPVRIGLSATPAKDQEKSLLVEGLIGKKVLGKIGIKEGIDLGILSRPTIRLVPVPEKKGINELKKYQSIYDAGIVNYTTRNKLVADEANKLVKSGKTVLIFCERKIHLENVAVELNKFDIKYIVVQGETEGNDRIDAKNMLDRKEIDCIVASKVFVAGMDCPSLDAIINASGMQGETALIQKVGRALRIAEGKDSAVVIDFLDPFSYLAQHAIQRLSIYAQKGWL